MPSESGHDEAMERKKSQDFAVEAEQPLPDAPNLIHINSRPQSRLAAATLSSDSSGTI